MKRLTIDTKILFCDIAQCRETPGGSFCEDGYCDQRRVYERLREYERIGLAPEDIPSGLELTEVYSAIRLLQQYEAIGTIADLTALVKAVKDGRVVVLPCKVGDTVYTIYDNGEDNPQIETRKVFEVSTARIWLDSDCYCFSYDYFSETVFLTRAEAEAALEGVTRG